MIVTLGLSMLQPKRLMTRASWVRFSCSVTKTPGSSRAAPANTKCRPMRVFPAPDGPAMSVVEPDQ